MKRLGHDAIRHTSSLVEEFKTFAFKGNVLQLAVAVILGTAFGKIIESFVKNILMPLLSLILPGGQPWAAWHWTFHGKTIAFGLFLGELVNFLLVAAALFLFVVKFLGWFARSKEADPVVALTKDQALLTEIRDQLRSRNDPVVLTRG